LRAVDALAEGAPMLVVGWTHESDPVSLRPLLSTWGLTSAFGSTAAPRPSPPWRTLVLGPASSGKSRYAEALVAAEPAVDYLATGASPSPDDPEWTAKVARHRQRRPPWWRTVETTDLTALLAAPGAPVLLDSIGTWTAATLQRCGAWDDEPDWQQQWEQEVAAVVQAWRNSARRVVAVGEETGWGVVPTRGAGRIFRDCLGGLSRQLADQSERVVLVVAGQPLDLTPAGGTA
jgi:adenosylcobinamide kinase / adenosylcobinamide-phosphate guanylyltransferase